MEGEQKQNANPETSVSFAPTAAFVRAFGAAEARAQQREFERPNWCRPTDHGTPKIDPNLVAAAVVGVCVGAAACYVVWRLCLST
jgi:hypothetical protein